MTTQERIAAVALLMSLVGGILFALVYVRGGGEGPFGLDDAPDPPDDPGGDEAHPWWPEFERELRDYERERSSERELALTCGEQRGEGRRD